MTEAIFGQMRDSLSHPVGLSGGEHTTPVRYRTYNVVAFVFGVVFTVCGLVSSAYAHPFLVCTERYGDTLQRSTLQTSTLQKSLERADSTAKVALDTVLTTLLGDDAKALSGGRPSLEILGDGKPNAYAVAKDHKIVVTRALLERFRTPSEAAFVIAHELGHLALGHGQTQSAATEREADDFALSLVAGSGFDVCSGISFLEQLGSHLHGYHAGVRARVDALRSASSQKCPSLSGSAVALELSGIPFNS